MARKVNQPHQEGAADQDADLSDFPLIEGGAPGVVDEAASVIAEPGKPTSAVPSLEREDLRDLPQPKQFRVLQDITIMYGGYHVPLRRGKVVTEITHDLSILHRQGVRLEEITK